jgi:hypothetical protein
MHGDRSRIRVGERRDMLKVGRFRSVGGWLMRVLGGMLVGVVVGKEGRIGVGVLLCREGKGDGGWVGEGLWILRDGIWVLGDWRGD